MRAARRTAQPVCYNEDEIEIANGKVVKRRKKSPPSSPETEAPKRPEPVLVSLPNKAPRKKDTSDEDVNRFHAFVGKLPDDPTRPNFDDSRGWHARLSKKLNETPSPDTQAPSPDTQAPSLDTVTPSLDTVTPSPEPSEAPDAPAEDTASHA